MSFDKISAARMASFVEFAYNMFAVSKAGGTLTPAPDPGIDEAGCQLTFWLTARDFRETVFYGFIAQSKLNPGDIVIAIRGTESPAEWLLDFSALPVFFHASAEVGFVALGFQSIQQSFAFLDGAGLSCSLADAVARISATVEIQSLAVIGHSLGGALATLSAAELAARNTAGVKASISLYTYASPRVGLIDFAAWCNTNIATSYRIWNLLDIVPETPTFPYTHVSGLGDCVVQNAEQLARLSKFPRCEHHLRTYQWLLDPASFPLDYGCSTARPASAAMHLAEPGSAEMQQIEGVMALQKAIGSRM